MLVIRAEQERAFEAKRLALFEDKLARYLSAKYIINLDDSLRARVHRGVIRAEHHGLVMQRSVATFLEWTIEEGEDFDDDPVRPMAREALTDRDVPEPIKLELLIRSRPWTAPIQLEMAEDSET
jgi:hypothetical protein